MTKNYITPSLGWFLRKIAIDYVRYGYVFYALNTIPERKGSDEELRRIDEKIIKTFRVTYHRTTRVRRRTKGLANAAYVRYRRWTIVLWTEGTHEDDQFERSQPKDIREVPFHFCGYVVSLENGSVRVTMTKRRTKRIRIIAEKIALHRQEKVTAFFLGISHSIHFPGVVWQKLKVLRLINKKRRAAGLPRITWTIPKP